MFKPIALIALLLAIATRLGAQTPAQPKLTAEEARGAAGDQTNYFGDSPNNPGPIAADLDASLQSAAVKNAIRKVADWQLARAQKHFNQQWTFGALYCGMLAASQSTGDLRYHDAMVATGELFKWDIQRAGGAAGAQAAAADAADDPNAPPPPDPATVAAMRTTFPINANSLCLSQTYLELYNQYQNDWMIMPTRSAMDDNIKIEFYPTRTPGRTGGGGGGGGGGAGGRGGGDQGQASATNPHHLIWWWCDALYMAPAAWVRMYKVTDEQKYLDYTDHQWWLTSQYLYDNDEHLYYRDASFITKKEHNGKKVFWSRGEGWVIGGLVRVLQDMPRDYPDRPKFVQQFTDMCGRIAQLQGDDGLWRAGMLDPDYYGEPENSGSAFFVYGMAWGVNNGILDRATFEPVIEKGWRGLLAHIHADGRLDCIQQTGSGPAHFKTSASYVYGVGAFLLAGREVNRLAIAMAMEHRNG